MNAYTRLAVGVALSIVWAVVFVVGVDREALYIFVSPVAIAAIAASLLISRWQPPDTLVRHIVVGLAVGALLVVGTHVGFFVMNDMFDSLGGDVARLYGVAAVTPERLALVVAIASAEELLWRGLVHDALMDIMPTRPAVAVALGTLLYAVSQVGPQSGWLLLAAFLLGALWAVMRVATRSLVPSLVAHLVWTLSILGAVPLV